MIGPLGLIGCYQRCHIRFSVCAIGGNNRIASWSFRFYLEFMHAKAHMDSRQTRHSQPKGRPCLICLSSIPSSVSVPLLYGLWQSHPESIQGHSVLAASIGGARGSGMLSPDAMQSHLEPYRAQQCTHISTWTKSAILQRIYMNQCISIDSDWSAQIGLFMCKRDYWAADVSSTDLRVN